MEINERGFWEDESGLSHHHDPHLAQAILQLFIKHKHQYILDLGCGKGDYAHLFQAYNLRVFAYDGNPNTPQLTVGLGRVADLSKPFDCAQEIDAVISLEVGEHIPAEFEQVFLDNVVVNKPKLVVLSWAVPNQDGDGHVNCQSNHYIKAQMFSRGYHYNKAISMQLRSKARLWWFKNSLMVFEL